MLRFSVCLLFPCSTFTRLKKPGPLFRLLAFKFLFGKWEWLVLAELSDTRFHQCLISAHNSSWDTTLDRTCFFHSCINYFILFHPLLGLQEKSLILAPTYAQPCDARVKVVPSPFPHNLSSSVLPVPRNLLFWCHQPTFNFRVNNENAHQGWFQNWSKRSS